MATKKSAESSRIEIRISVTDTAREIVLESDSTREAVIDAVNEAMSSTTPLVLSDFRGRQVIVPAGKIGFVEIAAPTERKVGFATL
ncbi:MAG: DUF3107 domain-containing protein [Actinomycetota bacterium]